MTLGGTANPRPRSGLPPAALKTLRDAGARPGALYEVQAMQVLQQEPALAYGTIFELVDPLGNVLADITDNVVNAANSTPATVSHNCTDTTPGTLTFAYDGTLNWGADVVRPSMVVYPLRPVTIPTINGPVVVDPEAGVVFTLGAYVVASPQNDMTPNAIQSVTAYDRVYQLVSDVGDTFSVESGQKYSDGVMRLFVLAGNALANSGGTLNPAFIRFPAAWAAKTVPAGTFMTYPCDDSNNFQYVTIMNELLKASGCRPIYTDSDGLFVIEEIPKPAQQSPRWVFSRTPTPLDPDFSRNEVVTSQGSVHDTDLWNIANKIIYIQNGLTFNPTANDGSDGRYVINNSQSDPTHYHKGPDQESIGRVITSVRRLDASGQDDLIKQAEDDYTATYSQAETIQLKTAPWPVAGHYDVFLYADANLDRGYSRKVQTQSWELPLDGKSDMSWTTNVVADQ